MRLSAMVIVLTLLATTVSAQWKYRDPKAPRTAAGGLDVKAPAPRLPSGRVDLSGVWNIATGAYNANLAVDLSPEEFVMTPSMKALYDERRGNNSKDDPDAFCLPAGLPRANSVYPQKWVQTDNAVIVLYESRTTFRQIFFTDDHSLPADSDEINPTWMGYSKGRWEGDTLVVETTHFNGKTWFDDNGHSHTDQLKLTERIRRPSFGQLVIESTIVDPSAYQKPFTIKQEFRYLLDGELIEYSCNENNIDIHHLVGK